MDHGGSSRRYSVLQRRQLHDYHARCHLPQSGKELAMPFVAISGTSIGDMTAQGGLAAAFDTVTVQTSPNSAVKTGGTGGYIGKTVSPAVNFGRAIIYGSSNDGFDNAGANTITINIRGKNGAAPTSRTDGTIIGTSSFTDASDSAPHTVDSTDIITAYDHIFADISSSAGGLYWAICAELFLYSGSRSGAQSIIIPY